MSATTIPRQVLAIIGTGGMGLATARRLAAGRTVFLADASESNLKLAAQSLQSDGHSHIHTQVVDVADFESVKKFASASAKDSPTGVVETVVHTAGLSPAMAPANRILSVDLLGTANVIEAFEGFVGVGSSVTCIASIARFGAQGVLTPEMEGFLASAKREDLKLENNEGGVGGTIRQLVGENPALAYSISKAANILRVQAAARRYAERGARINSVSPGVILTEMVRKEMAGPSKDTIQGMIDGLPMRRGGAADEIAAAVAFLASRDASYVTGADLVVDGGFTAGTAGRGALSPVTNGQGKE